MTKKITLYGRAGIVGETLVDDEDYEWLNQFRWHLHPKGYATSGISDPEITGKQGQRVMTMQRVILGLKIGDPRRSDHINRDRLDNRRKNLRTVTDTQSLRNRGKFKNSRSKYKGLSWNKQEQKWGIVIRLGFFDISDEKLASEVYQWAIDKIFNSDNQLRFWEERKPGR